MKPAFALDRHRLLLCLGPGGVGNTTISAALGLRGALEGHATSLMTVDPVPRLLDALGLDLTSPALQTVDLHGLGARRGGRLQAMRLDPRHVFDGLIDRYAPSSAARAAILTDRIYRSLSRSLAGVADYMAMEQLLELTRDTEDPSAVVVIDTPPALQALDFLDAPRRMLELLGSRAVSLLAPRRRSSASSDSSKGQSRVAFSVIDLAARMILGAFDRITGLNLLTDVQTFVRNFEGMYAGFAERAAAAQALIRADSSAIILVTVAEPEPISHIGEFIVSLAALELHPAAVVVNRITAPLPHESGLDSAGLPPPLLRKLKRNLADFAALKRRETAALDTLRASLPETMPILFAPDLGYEPRALADLATIARHLNAAEVRA
ncbi:MAG TPA: ArsA-related P-loop ATPase, partial [Candidatus Binataceae bacterium]|nr:ArsA-related P-loop ATPase [Candidatus Binataceae bacterium]